MAEQPGQPEDSATCVVHVRLLLLGNYLVLYSCFPLNCLNHFLPRKSSTLAFRGPVTQLRSYSVDVESLLYTWQDAVRKRLQIRWKGQDGGANTGPSPFHLKFHYPHGLSLPNPQGGDHVFFRRRTTVNEMMSVRHLERTCQSRCIRQASILVTRAVMT